MRRQDAVGVAAEFEVDGHRMTLGVESERLRSAEGALDGALQEMGGERGLRLVRHVLFAAERSAVRDEFHDDGLGADPEHGSDLIAVVPDSLAA